jgi:hypothetical protein
MTYIADRHAERVERADIEVRGAARVRDEFSDVVYDRGLRLPLKRELCVVQPEAIFDHRLSGVPLVGSAGVSSGLVGAEVHIRHGNLRDIFGGVLRERETTCRGDIAEKDVKYRRSAALSGIPRPKDRINLEAKL